MKQFSFYRSLHGSCSNIHFRSSIVRWSPSERASNTDKNPNVKAPVPEQLPNEPRQPGDKESNRIEHYENIVTKISKPAIKIETKIIPLYVLDFSLENDILKSLNERNTSSTNSTSQSNVSTQTFQYTSTTTAVEFKNMMQKLSLLEIPKIFTPHALRAKVSSVNIPVQKRGRPVFPFVTIRSTLRQQGVPRAGFASLRCKHTFEKNSAPTLKGSVEKRGATKVKANQFVEGSIYDGSFTNVTRMEIGRWKDDPNSIGLTATVQGLAQTIQEVKGEVNTIDDNTYGEVSSNKELLKSQSAPTGSNPTSDKNSVDRGSTVKGFTKPPEKDVTRGAKHEVGSTYNRATRELSSMKEFLKYQTPTGPPVPDPRPEAEMKACAVVTRKGALRDAKTLIAFNKASYAPRSLLDLKECVEYQYTDERTLATLQKIKALKLREIEYHKAQIKRHRKRLLELMFKTPFQKQEEDASNEPKPEDLK